jgi:DNA-binding NarL/FixJ family response regulator
VKIYKVMVVEDNDLIRAGLCHILRQLPNCQLVADAQTLAVAIEELSKQNIDVVLVKYRMPDGSASQYVPELRRLWPQTKLLLLLEDDEEFWEAIGVEADGFEIRHMPGYQLGTAIKALAEGYGWLGPMLSRYLIKRGGRQRLLSTERPKPSYEDDGVCNLTPREREIICLLSEGLKGDEIAEKLAISSKTVQLHVSSCLKKLDVEDRTQAILKFLRSK